MYLHAVTPASVSAHVRPGTCPPRSRLAPISRLCQVWSLPRIRPRYRAHLLSRTLVDENVAHQFVQRTLGGLLALTTPLYTLADAQPKV
eukprot:3978457-Prymnesium_polylepis.1